MSDRRKRKGSSPNAKTWLYAIVGLVALGAVVFALAGGGGENTDVSAAGCARTPVSSFMDIHGLAVDPGNPDELYVATHNGLLKATNDTGFARIGNVRDDLMGFSAHPTNGSIVWSSGHPASGGNMGVRLSRNGGCTWQTIVARDWDFHAMAVSPADPDRLWGFFRGELMRSTDGGHNWQVVAKPPPIGSLAPDARNAETLYAAAGQQGILKSNDGGATWQPFRAGGAASVAVDPGNPSVIYVGGQGSLTRSTDGGQTWEALRLPVPPDAAVGYIAVHPRDGNVVYAATYQVGIYKTTDGGQTWTTVKAPAR